MKALFAVAALAIAVPASAQIPVFDPSKAVADVFDWMERASAADAALSAIARQSEPGASAMGVVDIASNGRGYLVRTKSSTAKCFVTVIPNTGSLPMPESAPFAMLVLSVDCLPAVR